MKRFLPLLLLSFGLTGCFPPPPPAPPPPVKRGQPTLPPGSAYSAPPATLPAPAALPENLPVVKVALLLPLSGEGQALGADMLDAAQLALYDAYVNLPPSSVKARLILIPKDTGNSPTVAAQMASQALGQGAALIVGPLYSQSVSSVAPVAKAKGVSVIALSNNRAVAGDGVYVFGFLPDAQVARVAQYAMAQGLRRYGVLVPNDAYGQSIASTLEGIVKAQGGEITASDRYARLPANMQAAAGRLAQQQAATPAQALFLAEGGELAGTILSALESGGMARSSYQLLGTGVWDDASVRATPALRGGWFASAAPEGYARFEKRFESVYGYKPKRLSSLSYDAVWLAAQLVQARGMANFGAQALTDPQGFQGPANGAFRLLSNGITERALSVMEITPDGFKVLDPAPRDFSR